MTSLDEGDTRVGKGKRARHNRETARLQRDHRQLKRLQEGVQAELDAAEAEEPGAEERAVEVSPSIWIQSRPSRRPAPGETVKEGGYNSLPYCEISWGQVGWFAPLRDVRQTARDLFTAASYADMIGALLGLGADPQMVTGLLTQTMRRRLGCASTLELLPTGSSERGAGMVRLQHGGRIGMVTPEGGREMGQHWLTVAAAAEHDELLHEVLADAAGLDESARDKVLGYMKAVRTDPDAAARDLRLQEETRVAAMFAEHPGVTDTGSGGVGERVGWERPLHFLDGDTEPRPQLYRYSGTGVGVRRDLLDTVLHGWAHARETACDDGAAPGSVQEVEEMARTLIVATLNMVDDDPARAQVDQLVDYLRDHHGDALADSTHHGKGPADTAIGLLRAQTGAADPA